MKILTRPQNRIQMELADNVQVFPLIEVMSLAHRPFTDPVHRYVIFLLSSPAAWPIVSPWAAPMVEAGQAKVICLSEGARQSVEGSGTEVSWVSPKPSVEGVMEEFPYSDFFKREIEPQTQKFIVVHPCSLGTQLKQSIFKMRTGLEVRNLPVYQTKLPTGSLERFSELESLADLEWFFYSGSAATNFLKLAPALERIKELNWKLYCVGQTSLSAFSASKEYPTSLISADDAQLMLRNKS